MRTRGMVSVVSKEEGEEVGDGHEGEAWRI